MQRYRADVSCTQPDGATLWWAKWFGGKTYARINQCRIMIEGEPRRSVYMTGEPDTFFSIPAVTRYHGCRVTGYVTGDGDGNIVFHPTYY